MGLRDFAREAGRDALDLLYPRLCLACHAGLRGTDRGYLCAPCEDRLPRFGPEACPQCGQGIGPGALHVTRCPDCRGRRLTFDGAAALGPYRDLLRTLVLQLKLGGERALAWELGRLLADRLAADPRAAAADLVIPIPLHARTERDRGYNQSALLAADVARRLGKPCDPRMLVKARATLPQATLDAARRAENVVGAFAVRGPADVAGHAVLLVDDVLTTGATASEAAGTLKAAGAGTVFVAVVAR